MVDITAIILTKNEEKNIEECINSIINLVKRVVVVDSISSDKTIQIASSLGADVYVHPFENYARQFNWGLDNTNIETEWVLRIDADERLTPELCIEIENSLMCISENVNGFTLEAWLYFMGRKLRFGGTKKRKLMLFKNGVGRIEDRKMDEHTVLSEGTSVALKERFLHYDFKNLDFFVSKYNWYSTREMQDYFDYKNKQLYQSDSILVDSKIIKTRKKKFGLYYNAPIFLRAFLLFILNYFIKLGFLDGYQGFIYHFLHTYWYRTLVDAKIFEQITTQKPFEETGDLKA